MTARSSSPARRPRDRKAQILAAAMACFQRSGYQATGMEDIAAAVGITAGALYRHFRSKQELLGKALLDNTDRLMAVMDETENGLDHLMRAIASYSLDHRSYTVVRERESRHLAPADQAAVERHHAKISAMVTSALQASRPELSPGDARLIGWAALGVLTSPSYHRTDLPRPHFDDVLQHLATAACRTHLPSPAVPPATGDGAAAAPTGPGLTPVTRREALLAAALPLFAERGYQAVSMEDIGAAAGVPRLAVYQHFSGKAALLAAVLHRQLETRWAALTSELAQSSTPREALCRLLRSHAESTAARRGSGALLLVSELAHLSAADQEAFHRTQVDYVGEWTALLAACRPELSEAEARVTVHAALGVLNRLPRLALFTHRSDPVTVLAELGQEILGIHPQP